MANHFRKLCSGPSPPPQREEELHTQHFNPLTDSPIDVEETVRAIKKQKSGKAPGPDGLPSTLFKVCDTRFVNHLTLLFNKVLNAGVFPKAWSLGNIKPFTKKETKATPTTTEA